jgi:hypothetical protein
MTICIFLNTLWGYSEMTVTAPEITPSVPSIEVYVTRVVVIVTVPLTGILKDLTGLGVPAKNFVVLVPVVTFLLDLHATVRTKHLESPPEPEGCKNA